VRCVLLVVAMTATLLAGAVLSSPPAQANEATRSIATTVQRLVASPALGSNVGVHARGVPHGRSIVDVAAKRGFIPASTMKVITAYSAIRALGPDHRFTTTVYRTPRGRWILQGGGDPVLTSRDLQLLAARVARAVKRTDGSSRIVVDFDDGLFGEPVNAVGWEAGDMPRYVSAVRGLGLLGSYATDTAAVATRVFVDHLAARGLSVRMGSRTRVDPNDRIVARFRGNTVAKAIFAMMPQSENNVAEVLFRHVALGMGQPATWIGARRATRAVLRRDGLPSAASAFVDGSGLSYRNRLTPILLTEVLSRLVTNPRLAAIRESLPVAGVNGTMARRFVTPPSVCARGAVFAKTGSLPMTVSTLAGLTTSPDGTVRAFAVMVNDRPSQAAWSATSAAIDSVAAAVQGCVR
jgi:D-alanyl-D-alanine carboxypeptidase/D-alanyl-D-alanine-endopeptidase (penicillin-binding protein 4)